MYLQIGAHETIVLKLEVNPAIVGGLTVQIGDKFMDLSISSKIASMKVCELLIFSDISASTPKTESCVETKQKKKIILVSPPPCQVPRRWGKLRHVTWHLSFKNRAKPAGWPTWCFNW